MLVIDMLSILGRAYEPAVHGRMPEAVSMTASAIKDDVVGAKAYLSNLENVLAAGRLCFTTRLYRDILKGALAKLAEVPNA